MKKNEGKVAVVTGGSSGIGKAAAKRLLSAGFIVYELSRKEREKEEKIIHVTCDVTDFDAVKVAVEKIYSEQKRIDVLVNNAGGGISGAVEFTKTEDAKKLFDVNFFGAVNLCRAVIPFMREQGFGRIINLSSVAGELSIPYQSFYSATKAAINSLTLALRNELKPFKITVCALMPGDVCTGFTASRKKSSEGDDIYKGHIEKAVSQMEKDEQNGMSPDVLGKKIARLAIKKRVKPFYTCGTKYKLFLFLAKILPRSFSNYIVGKLY